MTRVIKAPERIQTKVGEKIVFLSGSIEMGAAKDWQARVATALKRDSNVVILNPRRDDWASSWVQSIDNPQFNQQVAWELDGLGKADVILMYFDPTTKSPITLLELGLCAADKPCGGLVGFNS